MSESLDYEVKPENKAYIEVEGYPSFPVARINNMSSRTSPALYGAAPAQGYSTVNLYSVPNNPVSLYPSSSYRRTISTNAGNVGIRG